MLLRSLQQGESLGMPHSKPMPSIGKHCHELRIRDIGQNWRLIYRIHEDAILVLEVFNKTTRGTPINVIENGKKRLKRYDTDREE